MLVRKKCIYWVMYVAIVHNHENTFLPFFLFFFLKWRLGEEFAFTRKTWAYLAGHRTILPDLMYRGCCRTRGVCERVKLTLLNPFRKRLELVVNLVWRMLFANDFVSRLYPEWNILVFCWMIGKVRNKVDKVAEEYHHSKQKRVSMYWCPPGHA